MRNYISPIILNKIPEFLKTDYKLFYNFLKDYFEFLELDGNPLEIIESYLDNTEPNNETNIYIDKILNDLGFDINLPLTISKSELVLHLRDFYLSRGSEKSFKFLFKLLYNNNVSIDYPRKKLFVLSNDTYAR